MGKKSRTKREKQSARKTEKKNSLSLSKTLIFSVVSVIGIFLLLEGIFFIAGYKPFIATDPYVGFQAKFPLYISDKGKNGEKIYRTANNKLNFFNMQSFPATKSENTFRIFTLGGSTTYGRPYFDNASFSGWLREFLKSADPKRNWEVINSGGVSYASYRVAALMEELLQYEPDLFIVYSGHNEFLESRTYSGIIEEPVAVTKLKLFFGNFRLYSFLNNLKEKMFAKKKETKETYKLKGEVNALLDNSAGPDIYYRDDKLKEQILNHYQFNLNRMVELAKSHNAQIVFVTTPVNSKDFSPFKSQHKDEIARKNYKEYEKLLNKASMEIDDGRYDEAIIKLKGLINKDHLYAFTHYELGRALFALGRQEEAKKEFAIAIDEDVAPLRRLSPMDNIVKRVAQENKTPLIDFTQTLESDSLKKYHHTVLGKEYFLDHVHPTIEAHRILGLQLLNKLIDLDIVRPANNWGEFKINEIVNKVERGIDKKAHAHAEKILARVLIWAGKRKEAAQFAKSAAGSLKDDAEAQFHNAFSLEEEGKFEEAIAGYKRALKLDPKYLLAFNNLIPLLNKTGNMDEALSLGEKAIQLFPESAKIYNNYGQVLYNKKRFGEAAQSFNKSLELDPNSSYTHSNLGLAYSALSYNFKAINSFEAAIKLDPKDLESKRYLGLALAMSGQYEIALIQFEEILEADPDNRQVLEYVNRIKRGNSQ